MAVGSLVRRYLPRTFHYWHFDMRVFADADGAKWRAELISHGQTSEYLNPKVHKPIVQFTCLDRRRPRRYLGFAPDQERGLDSLSEADLQELLARAAVH